MPLETAIQLTEILLAIAFIQNSLEHLHSCKDAKLLFYLRIIFSFFLIFDFWVRWVNFALVILAVLILKRFQGPYNGGSDRMSYLILCCLCLINFMPIFKLKEYIFGYLAMQLVLSYCISGWFKFINPDWRNGQALQDIFLFSNYPVDENLRNFANFPIFLTLISWSVMLFELIFPLFLLTKNTLLIGLIVASLFHFGLAILFGLNRFFWAWIAAHPSVIWLQERLFLI